LFVSELLDRAGWWRGFFVVFGRLGVWFSRLAVGFGRLRVCYGRFGGGFSRLRRRYSRFETGLVVWEGLVVIVK
jgi:hypothetical protein